MYFWYNLSSAVFLLCITFHRSLRALGIKLMSLANTYTHSNGMGSTIHVLEAADIRWLGLNSKQHEIVMAGGKKFGFLAFCGVHRECIESPSFPFAPLKYNPKVATGAISELKEVSDTIGALAAILTSSFSIE